MKPRSGYRISPITNTDAILVLELRLRMSAYDLGFNRSTQHTKLWVSRRSELMLNVGSAGSGRGLMHDDHATGQSAGQSILMILRMDSKKPALP